MNSAAKDGEKHPLQSIQVAVMTCFVLEKATVTLALFSSKDDHNAHCFTGKINCQRSNLKPCETCRNTQLMHRLFCVCISRFPVGSRRCVWSSADGIQPNAIWTPSWKHGMYHQSPTCHETKFLLNIWGTYPMIYVCFYICFAEDYKVSVKEDHVLSFLCL